VHLKGADSMAVSGLSLRNISVGSGWATAVLLCMNRLSKQSSHSARHPFPAWKPLSQSGGCRLSAVTIASSSMGRCGLSHEHAEEGCKSTCVEFGG